MTAPPTLEELRRRLVCAVCRTVVDLRRGCLAHPKADFIWLDRDEQPAEKEKEQLELWR